MLGWIDLPRSKPTSSAPTGDATAAGGGFAFNALLTGLAQSAVAIAAGINAALLGSRHPASAATDGLFTAFAVYGMVVIISSSTRTALVPHLIDERRSFKPFNEMLVSLLWATPLIGLLFAFVIPPAIVSVTGAASKDIVNTTLLILWPATLGQFVTALGAAMLGVLDDYHSAAFGYAGGGVTSVVAFIALEPRIGLEALPLAVLTGTAVMTVVVLTALSRRGWRPAGIGTPARTVWNWHRTLIAGSAYYVFGQSLYLVSAAVAAKSVGEGAATLYAYGYFAIGLVLSFVTVGSALVIAAPIAADWDDDPSSLEPVETDALRATLLMLALFVPAAALIGDDVAGAVLTSFGAKDVSQIIDVLVALTPMAIGVQMAVVPLTAIYARKRLALAATVGAATLVAQTLITIALAQLGELVWIAVAASISQILQAILLLAILHEHATGRRLLFALRDIATIAIPSAVSFIAAQQVFDSAGLTGAARDTAALIAGGATLLAAIWLAIPSYRGFIRGVTGSLLGDARRLRG